MKSAGRTWTQWTGYLFIVSLNNLHEGRFFSLCLSWWSWTSVLDDYKSEVWRWSCAWTEKIVWYVYRLIYFVGLQFFFFLVPQDVWEFISRKWKKKSYIEKGKILCREEPYSSENLHCILNMLCLEKWKLIKICMIYKKQWKITCFDSKVKKKVIKICMIYKKTMKNNTFYFEKC